MIRKSSEKQVERKPAPFNGTGEIQMASILNGPEEMQGLECIGDEPIQMIALILYE